jgi:hypothetical protein
MALRAAFSLLARGAQSSCATAPAAATAAAAAPTKAEAASELADEAHMSFVLVLRPGHVLDRSVQGTHLRKKRKELGHEASKRVRALQTLGARWNKCLLCSGCSGCGQLGTHWIPRHMMLLMFVWSRP